ncbi:MAG: metallophosphoesterase [Ignavibacteriae bacterium]|nr:metallophosphoesterase [Ignavibacteriota bacterium]
MNTETAAIILLNCESSGAASAYADSSSDPVTISSHGREVIVISDLHIAAGKRKDGVFSGTENFLADASFRRFVEIGLLKEPKKKALLIINGDFIDFIRIVRVPASEAELLAWQHILSSLGVNKTIDELRASVSKKEIEYGLKTDDYKSVWKLSASVAGHPEIFQSLAKWIDSGHSLIITKGNHDLEWYWLLVRNYLRLVLAEHIAESRALPVEQILAEVVLPAVTFVDKSLLIDGDCYVEHGHCFDKFSSVVGAILLKKRSELNIPFGSFFNRYLINKIELSYPYIDNVRPQQSMLSFLVREHFPLALKLLFYHLPFGLKMIRKRYFAFMFGMPALFVLAIGVPVLVVAIQLFDIVSPLLSSSSSETSTAGTPVSGFVLRQGIGVLRDLGGIVGSGIVSYWLGRFVAWFRLREPNSLAEDAKSLLMNHSEYRIVTFGHTHNPEQLEENGRWYFNTGTWIPILEASSAEIRHDKTYTFLRLAPDERGRLQPTSLQRWNDDAERMEPLSLVERITI